MATTSVVKGKYFNDFDSTEEVNDTDVLLLDNGSKVLKTTVKTLVSDKIQKAIDGLPTTDDSKKIYGIKRALTSNSPYWVRTDDSIGMFVKADVGTTPGYSSFDAAPIYKDIQRETINGDVMVKIPKFYYQRTQDDVYEYIRISNVAQDGFTLHAAFNRPDGERDAIYVGAYEMTTGFTSKTGLAPLVNQTRAQFRSGAKAKGTNYSIIDIATVFAIIDLIRIEYATDDVQTAIGAGVSGVSAAVVTGKTDSVINLNGRSSGTDNASSVVWRGIENFWGNVWEFVDGININNGQYYYSNNISSYADDVSASYTQLSYKENSTSWSGSYITKLGYDSSNPELSLPETAGSGSSSTYCCDAAWSNVSWRVFCHGGTWGDGAACGLFASIAGIASSSSYSNFGSRLLYIPL